MAQRNFITIIVVLFCILFTAQGLVAAEKEWFKVLNGVQDQFQSYHHLTPVSVEVIPNRDQLVIGQSWGRDDEGIFVTKLNSHGTVVYKNLYGGGYDYASTCIVNGSENIFFGNRSGKVLIFKTDQYGEVIANSAYTIELYYSLSVKTAIKTQDGGYLLYCRWNPLSSDKKRIFLKMDSNFTVEWQTTFDYDDSSVKRDELCEVPGQGYFFIHDSQKSITKLNLDGSLGWSKKCVSSQYWFSAIRPMTIEVSADGNIVVAGTYRIWSNEAWKSVMFKLTPNGNLVENPSFFRAVSDKKETISDIVETSKGTFLLTGNAPRTASSTQSYMNTFVMETSSDFVPLWGKLINGTYPMSSSPFVIETDNSSIYVSGGIVVLSGSEPSVMHAKLGMDGTVSMACSLSMVSEVNFEHPTVLMEMAELSLIEPDRNITVSVVASSIAKSDMHHTEQDICQDDVVRLTTNFNVNMGESVTGVELNSGNSNIVLDCKDGDGSVLLEPGTSVELSAVAKPGHVFIRWEDSLGNIDTNNSMTVYMSDDEVWTAVFAAALPAQNALTNQSFDASRIKEYPFSVNGNHPIAIISGGNLDVKARVLDLNGDPVLDYNDNEYSNGYTDIGMLNQTNGHAQVNFMYRKQNIPIGDYVLEVTPESSQSSVAGSFSIVFLRKTTHKEVFFEGMLALLGDGDASNDYLDVYVKALYPEIYSTVSSISALFDYSYGCWNYDGVRKERQCKALVNFFSNRFLNKGSLLTDDSIFNNWLTFTDADSDCVADNDYIMITNESDLVFHSQYDGAFGSVCGAGDYFYDPETNQVSRNISEVIADFVKKGDIFVQRLTTYNHYGIVIDGNVSFDANAQNNGMLHWKSNLDEQGDLRFSVRNQSRWKVTRP